LATGGLVARAGADKPLAVQLFGEELILFRDGAGKPALIGRYCAHQGVDMSYGRVEADVIRCMYHGWLFDACGKVVVRGSWVEGGEKRMAVGQPAYPCIEAGGVIFTYMGAGTPPVLPSYEFLTAPPERRAVTKVLINRNYLDATDDNNDAEHPSPSALAGMRSTELELADLGLRILTTGKATEGKQYLNVTNFIYPNLSAFTGSSAGEGYATHWHVPIDDGTHWRYAFLFSREQTLTEEVRDRILARPCVADCFESDRRSRETLLAGRNLLLQAVQDLREGREPPHIPRHLSRARTPKILVLSEMIAADVDACEYVRRLERAL
jgi:nitrite reductase/ring-hydroxylating ferredoxin subunit